MSRPFTVVASVGTYHRPFDRLADWLEPWAGASGVRIVFQHGATRPLRAAENHAVLDPVRLVDHYEQADALVLQGGAGGVMDARTAGRIPIVVPRIPCDGEVVDDHQVVLSRRLAATGVVHLAETSDALDRLLTAVRDGTVATRTAAVRPGPGIDGTVQVLDTAASTAWSRGRLATALGRVTSRAPV